MIADKLLEKAKEAFVLAVEIYNKPTIKYRVEGFTFFICNAWELMLKAYLIKTKGEESIYYKNNPERAINLENCIKLIFTNDKDPLRLNLEKIIELRNTSTHFISFIVLVWQKSFFCRNYIFVRFNINGLLAIYVVFIVNTIIHYSFMRFL